MKFTLMSIAFVVMSTVAAWAQSAVENDAGFWKMISNWLWAPLSGAIALIYLLISHRFKKVEEMAGAAVTQETFKGYVQRSEKSKEHMWEELKKLREDQLRFERATVERYETLTKDGHEKYERLLQAIYNLKGD